MSYTLLLRLAGPMQAWGLQSRFSLRDTAREPTKSGVVGLIASALGRPRQASIDDLTRLRMGVRVLREGQMRYDFHTAQDIVKASAKIRPGKPVSPSERKDTEPSTRYYLADAWFLVGLESTDRMFLEDIDAALGAPRWPLFLGRKAFVPSLPVRIVDTRGKPTGLMPLPLWKALIQFQDPCGPRDTAHRLVLDADALPQDHHETARRMQPDHPLSFEPRRFLPREVVICMLQTENSYVSK
jgi:CRISPR system Cascade subunit CasD